MKIVEIDAAPGFGGLVLGALRSSRKRPGPVSALPEITYVQAQARLDAAHLARYGQVCGFSEAHGVPVSYPQLLTFPLVMAFVGSPECPWPAMGTVHLANRIVQRQRLRPGEPLRVEVATGQLLSHEKGQAYTLELRILRDGELVWEATQTLLRLGVQSPSGPAFVSDLKSDLALSHQADLLAPANIGRRYAAVSGDRTPIHLWALTAKLLGFRRAIAHGLWTQARALAALLPRDAVAQAELSVEFKTPLFLPARASLWTTREAAGPLARGALFEVRDAAGRKPHLRGRLSHA